MPRKREPVLGDGVGATGDITPQNVSQKLKKTRSQSQNAFPDGLDRIHSRLMPTTSTPKVDLTSRKVTKRDIETAFGFDDTVDIEANYSTLISPIAHAAPKAGAPVWKVSPLTQRNVDLEELSKHRTRPPEEVSERRSQRLKKKGTTKQKQRSTNPKGNNLEKTSGSSVLTPTAEAEPGKTVGVSNPKPPTIPIQKSTSSSLRPLPVVQESVASSSKSAAALVQESFKPAYASSSKPSVKPKPVKKATSASSTKQSTSKPLVQKTLTEFSQLLDRYKEPVVDPELQIDPKKIIRTYGSSARKRIKIHEERDSECDYDFTKNVRVEFEEQKKLTKRTKKKGGKAKNGKGDHADDLDEETERWLKEKNKEFEDVLKAPLVIENSFSD